MSDIFAELTRVRDAFDKPTLRLLDRKWAPLVLAIFRTIFTRDQRIVPAERLHAQVDNYLDELRLAGETVPDSAGRALCKQWLGHNWLVRTRDDAGAEHYSLTSHALEALDLVQSLTRDRAMISESRIHTILDLVRRVATDANPDRQTRIDRLERRHDCISVGDRVQLPYTPRVVVISENKDTAVAFPPVPGGIAVEGGGFGGGTAAAMDWLNDAPVLVYWGDIDAPGFQILNGFRAAGIRAVSMLMDMPTFETYEQFGTNLDRRGDPIGSGNRRDLSHLTEPERTMYDALTDPSWTRHRRLEQERIPLDDALVVLVRLQRENASA